ncbi:HET-domain-containing protein [Xylariaceae sp. AK1471]|nr:HET-domain-containing protein [Xylariaceae sp. AK1471]
MFGREEDEQTNSRIEELGYYTLFTVTRKPGLAMMGMYVGNRQGAFEMVPHDFGDEDINLDISPSTGNDHTWRIIQGWLDRCLHTHHACNEKAPSGYIPSRLVELNHTASEPTFRVVERHQIGQRIQYLTLSHHWGSKPSDSHLKLTQSTYQLLSKEQPVSNLLKTFRDTVTVAARLGLRYLWIDSLCIFQDSESDWRAESSVMAEVYGNAYLSIAALGAENDDGGLFFSRDPAKVKTTVFNFGVDGPETTQPYRFRLEKGWSWRLSFDREPLTKRGWVMQERLLAPRVLLEYNTYTSQFGSKQVFWECHETICCETHPRTVDCSTSTGTTKPAVASVSRHAWKELADSPCRSLGSSVKDTSQLFADWYSIQELYSRCNLTVPSDKLVAISGLAKDMKRQLAELGCEDTRYLAGIWNARLPQALVWNVRDGGIRPDAYRAPSWSWAAIDAVVNMHDWISSSSSNLELLATVTGASTTPLNPNDETGQVSDGILTLRGALFIANLRPYVKEEVINEINRNIRDFEDIESGEVLVETPTIARRRDGGPIWAHWSVNFDTKADISDRVLCLPVTRSESKYANCSTYWHVGGLVVREDGEAYRRIGCLSLTVEAMTDISPAFENVLMREISII